MRAAIVTAFGDADVLSVEFVEPPQPAIGTALIRVEAASVAFADTLTRRGMYPPGLTEPGIISGGEAVGRVVSVGGDDAHEMVGKRVFAYTGLGCHAEFVNAPLDRIIPVGEEMDPKAVAAFGVTALVARVALKRAGVGPDTIVLIRGAAGGLGSAAVRLACMAGATVHATASSGDRAAYVEQIGAELVLDREGRTRSGERPPCDVVIDPVGGSDLSTFIPLMRPNGRYILLGGAGGPPARDFAEAMLANFYKAPSFSTLSLHAIPTDERTAAFEDILTGYKAGMLSPDIDCVLTLDEIKDAHRRVEAGDNLGKIVLAMC